jgi:general secretion pathway protein K
MNGPRSQRGVALLAAILLVAVGTILAASIAFDSAMAARRGVAGLSFEQSIHVAEGAEALAATALRQDDPKVDSFSDVWAQPFGPAEISPGIVLEASVEDMQGRFNLNSLVNAEHKIDTESLKAFQRLLEILELEPKWADQIADWISPDSASSGHNGLDDSATTSQDPPYRPANTIITSASELLALPEFGRERYLKLAPHVTALPPHTPLNVCTASGPVLDAMVGPGIQQYRDPKQLAESRTGSAAKDCFPPLDIFVEDVRRERNLPPGDAAQIQQYFSKSSSYFRVTSLVSLGGSEFALYSLLERPPQTGSGTGQRKVRVLQRSFTPD